MPTRDRLRWILLAAVGLFIAVAGYFAVGVVVIFVALLAGWWHSEILRRKQEGE